MMNHGLWKKNLNFHYIWFAQTEVLGRGRIVKAQLDKAIGSKLSLDNTLCTDAWRAFSTYAKIKG